MTDAPSVSGPAPESERNFNRLKKVAHAPDWKGGKPVSHEKAVGQAIKYVRLESCEDTLDGLVVTPPAGDLLAANTAALVEDYRLRSAPGEETAGSPCLLGRDFRDPLLGATPAEPRSRPSGAAPSPPATARPSCPARAAGRGGFRGRGRGVSGSAAPHRG